ncbi:hypothetical protein WR25_07405 [Diploscapter pachys]|uniref:Uncharacterized protein n=1 Tax=Diploscapter pachys TaxID=2018661 RepID=A0A2A2KR08_9BILA|nr:hypothetical protein WR25_07405 [Diploscapter pachys]
MRTKKRVLQMNDEELAALLAVVMPGRTIDGLRKDERQEMCIKWLFANSLSMNHEFTFDRQEDEVFVLMNNRKPCSCCRKDCDRVTMSAFDRTPLGASLLQQLEPTSSKLQNGVIPESSVNQEEDKSTPARPRTSGEFLKLSREKMNASKYCSTPLNEAMWRRTKAWVLNSFASVVYVAWIFGRT